MLRNYFSFKTISGVKIRPWVHCSELCIDTFIVHLQNCKLLINSRFQVDKRNHIWRSINIKLR